MADLKRLFNRVQKPIAESVAQVGVIDASQPGGLLGEADELIGVGVAARGIVETGGQAKGALLQPLAHHGPHVGEIGVGGRFFVPPHGADSDGGVADDVGDVHGHLVIEHGQVLRHRGPTAGEGWRPVQARVQLDEVQKVIVRRERRVGVAVDSHQLGGDALADLGMVLGFGQDHETGVGVHVDKPGADHLAGGVDDPCGLDMRVVSPEYDNALTLNAHSGVETRVARTVDHQSVLDQDVQQGATSSSHR